MSNERFVTACKDGNVRQVQKQLEADASLASVVDSDGETVLMKAAAADSADIVKLLLQHGADPTATSKLGTTVMDVAAKPLQDVIVAHQTARSSSAAGDSFYMRSLLTIAISLTLAFYAIRYVVDEQCR